MPIALSIHEITLLPPTCGKKRPRRVIPLHQVDHDRVPARVSGPQPLDLAKGDHPLCPERTVVLPYPAVKTTPHGAPLLPPTLLHPHGDGPSAPTTSSQSTHVHAHATLPYQQANFYSPSSSTLFFLPKHTRLVSCNARHLLKHPKEAADAARVATGVRDGASGAPPPPLLTRGATAVFFAGTLRSRRCGRIVHILSTASPGRCCFVCFFPFCYVYFCVYDSQWIDDCFSNLVKGSVLRCRCGLLGPPRVVTPRDRELREKATAAGSASVASVARGGVAVASGIVEGLTAGLQVRCAYFSLRLRHLPALVQRGLREHTSLASGV